MNNLINLIISEEDGKTVLMKALLSLKRGQNNTVEYFIDIAEKHAALTEKKTGEKNDDLKKFINAAYTGTGEGESTIKWE